MRLFYFSGVKPGGRLRITRKGVNREAVERARRIKKLARAPGPGRRML